MMTVNSLINRIENSIVLGSHWPDNEKAEAESALIKEAKELQDACNPVAVALALNKIGRICYALGYGSDQTAKHPAFKATLGKLCSLSEIEHSGIDAYAALYNYKE